MNRILAYILIVASCVLAGCAGRLDIPEDGRADIAFDVSMEQTKALISPANLNTEGNRFMIYDVHTSEKGLDQYIKDQYLQYTQGQWNFVKSSTDATVVRIPWTKKGTHDFLAYNVHDASADKSIPVEVLYNTYSTAKQQSLRVPETGDWTLAKDNQFDFIYGSATRNVETDGYAPLPMNFKHLFAAVAVEVRNASTQQLKLSGLSFSNIKDKGNAVVNYDGTVQYTLSASGADGLFAAIDNEVTISVGGSITLYDGIGQAFLIWPHSVSDLANASITVSYKLGSDINTTTKTISLTENYTVKTWLVGNKYKYLIAVTDDNISLDVMRVVEWINDDVILEE